MKGEKRLNQIEEIFDKLYKDLDLGLISENEFEKGFTPLRKEMAEILYNDAKRELTEIEIEIK